MRQHYSKRHVVMDLFESEKGIEPESDDPVILIRCIKNFRICGCEKCERWAVAYENKLKSIDRKDSKSD